MARVLATNLKLMRDKPAVREKMIAAGSSPESFEAVRDLPDFVLDHYADSMARVAMEDPAFLQGKSKELDPKRINDLMLGKKDVVKWFNHLPSDPKLSQDKLNHDGSMLLCGRGSGRFECGLFKEAVIFYKRAIEVEERNKVAWFGLADALDAVGDKVEAAQARARAQELDKD